MRNRIGSTTARLGVTRNFLRRAIRAMCDPSLPLVLETYFVLLIVDLAVRTVGIVPVWKRIRARCRSTGRDSELDRVTLNRLVRAVRGTAEYHLYSMRCLSQSLALAWLLAERGFSAHLCIGVACPGGDFTAHAWLERNGVAINDPTGYAQRYFRLRSSGTL